MVRPFPTGWFERDLLWWGESLNSGTCLSRGARLEVPDLRSADVRLLIDLKAQNSQMLSALGEGSALQVHWTVEDDFKAALARYAKKEGGSDWSRRTRAIRKAYYDQRLSERSLRRERIHAYLGRRCQDLGKDDIRSVPECESYLRQGAIGITAQMRSLELSCPLARWELMDTPRHALHLRKLLNPSLGQLLAGDVREALLGFDPHRSVRSNCLRSDIDIFAPGGSGSGNLLYFDGHYHALFVMRELPRGTRPGMLIPMLDGLDRGISVTLNIYPLSVQAEIDRLRREIVELSAFLRDPKAIGVENDIQSRRARIDSLLSCVTVPFNILFVIRLWDPTLEGLEARSLALKSALHRLDGAEFMQVNNRAQARHLFYETLPGNLGSDYRQWDIYVESQNLSDLLPISSTFTGHLEEAQALYDSPGGSIVGIRFLAENATPQHSVVIGVNGSGKSALLMDLLSQSDADWHYRFLQEEGMSFTTLAQLSGLQSLVLRESGDCTLNPFDTFGLPLSSSTLAGAVKTCMKLIGVSRDEDKNKRREGLIGEYVHSHFEDCADDWKNADEDRWMSLGREALAADLLRKGDDDFLDGYLALRELGRSDSSAYQEHLQSASADRVVGYLTDRIGRQHVNEMVFTRLRSEDYPQFAGLVSLIRNGRKAHHRSAGMAEELDYLSSELAKGRRVGGVVGSFLDGATNIDFRGRGLHFDTSRLPEGPLKEVAGFAVFQRIRSHILSLPRSQAKVMLLDELRRVLLIPGATEFVKELLAQMRKYRCVFIGAFQEPSQIDDIDPLLTELLLGQCKQYFLMRQNNADQIRRIARVIGLPPVAQRSIAQHPLVEHQKGDGKASYCTYFSRMGGAPMCGTVRVEIDPYMLYVAESSGEIFDSRMKALKGYASVLEGVIQETDSKRKALS